MILLKTKKIENNHQETTKYLKSLPPPYSDSSSLFSPSWSIPRKKLVTGIIFPIEALIWSQFGQIRETTADREAAVGGLLPAFKSQVVKAFVL